MIMLLFGKKKKREIPRVISTISCAADAFLVFFPVADSEFRFQPLQDLLTLVHDLPPAQRRIRDRALVLHGLDAPRVLRAVRLESELRNGLH